MKLFTAFSCIWIILLNGCAASEWRVTDQKFFKYKNKDVRVAAKIMLTKEQDKMNPAKADGVDFETRIYSAAYDTIIKEFTTKAGESLESEGKTNTALIFTYPITEPRLGGTASNSYADLCAEIRMENSNLDDWTRVGCVNYNDTPSESPTGGLE